MNIYLKLYSGIPLTREEYTRLPAENYKEYGVIPFFIQEYADAWYDNIVSGIGDHPPSFALTSTQCEELFIHWLWKAYCHNEIVLAYLPQLINVLSDVSADKVVNDYYSIIRGTDKQEMWCNHFSYKFNYSYLTPEHLVDYMRYLFGSGSDVTATLLLNMLTESHEHPIYTTPQALTQLTELLTQYAHKDLTLHIKNNALLFQTWAETLCGSSFAFPLPSQSSALCDSEKASVAFVVKVLSYPIEQRWYFMWNYKLFYGTNGGIDHTFYSKQQLLKTLTLLSVCCPEYKQDAIDDLCDEVLEHISKGYRYTLHQFFELCYERIIGPVIQTSLDDVRHNIRLIIDNEHRIQNNLADYRLGLKQASFMVLLSEHFDCYNKQSIREIPLYV